MSMTLAATLFVLLVPLSMVAPMSADAADAPLPKNLPAYGPVRSLPPLQIAQKTLPNGLTVWVLPRNDGPPKVHFVLAVRGGLAADDFQHPGFAQLLAQQQYRFGQYGTRCGQFNRCGRSARRRMGGIYRSREYQYKRNS